MKNIMLYRHTMTMSLDDITLLVITSLKEAHKKELQSLLDQILTLQNQLNEKNDELRRLNKITTLIDLGEVDIFECGFCLDFTSADDISRCDQCEIVVCHDCSDLMESCEICDSLICSDCGICNMH